MVNSRRLYCLIALLLGYSGLIQGIELKPWFGNQLEFEFRPSLRCQSYRTIASDSKRLYKPANDLFWSFNLSNSPLPECSFELEATISNTRCHGNHVDALCIAGHYLWWDDVNGDPLSVMTGLIYTQAFSPSLRDIGAFHHGLYGIEAHISVGKERSSGPNWVSRWWGVAAIGMAEQGSPWLRASLNYQFSPHENHHIGLFGCTLNGLGSRRLHPQHFRGYGAIDHHSIDVGLSYRYDIEYFGYAKIDYAYRVYAYNFPAEAHSVTFSLLYTFGL